LPRQCWRKASCSLFAVNEIRRVEKQHLHAAGAGQQQTIKISTLFVRNDITEIMKRERRPYGRLF